MIYVTKPFLPPREEYQRYIDGIWKRNWLTNDGPLLNELELRIKDYLGLNHFLFLNNGTIALQIAIRALDLKGEIITTPFSFVATTTSIVWENCQPVFVDMDRNTMNIDATLIEKAITPKTSAILATHVYGNPCDIDTIEKIAQKHNLKVIYDAAHCFGVKYKGRSVFGYGDISITSFHATKLFHTVEGGGIFTSTPELTKRCARMRSFGFETVETFDGVGTNGKNSEFHAAMGLCNLKYIDEILRRRKQISDTYDELKDGLRAVKPVITPGTDYNYSYYPLVFESEEIMLRMKRALEDNKVGTRRYFYPVLSSLEYVKPYPTPVADDISPRVLCLPVYHDLTREEIQMICRIMLRTQNY